MLRSLINIRIVLWMCILSPLRAYYLKAQSDPGVVPDYKSPYRDKKSGLFKGLAFLLALLCSFTFHTDVQAQCTITSVDCNDSDCSTVDSVDPSTCECIHTPYECDDGKCYTEDWFNPATCECLFEMITCDDNDCTTADGFDEVTCSCQHITINCDDNDCRTTDIFNEATCDCDNIPLACDDDDCQTIDSFDANTCDCKFVPNPIVCDDQDCTTTDSLHPATCDCIHVPVDCDDQNCTTDEFYDDINCECVYTQNAVPDCDDGDCSTYDTYDPVTCNCVHNTSGNQLNCNDEIRVSVDGQCGAEILVDVFFEGEFDPDNFEFYILDEDGNEIELDDLSEYIGLELYYNVEDVCNGQTCWGIVVFEDKILPQPNCNCDTPYNPDGSVKPECSFLCYNIWDLEVLEQDPRSSNNILPPLEDIAPIDNCYKFGDPDVQIEIIEGDSCHSHQVKRTVTFEYPASHGEIEFISCTETFLFEALSLNNFGYTGLAGSGSWDSHPSIEEAVNHAPIYEWYWPQEAVQLPCGHATDVASIAAYFDGDTPYAPNNNNNPPGTQFDDRSQTEHLIENQEGVPYAYPYVVTIGYDGLYHAKPMDASICNMFAGYEDVEFEACGESCSGNTKILRSWTMLDWCSLEVVYFEQIIRASDYEGPTIEQPDITVSTDLWDCTADIQFPEPEHLYDECDNGEIVWTITGSGITNGIIITDNIAYDVPKGKFTFYYNAWDCCGNLTSEPIGVTILDQVAPVAIAKQDVVVSLTYTNLESSNGLAKIFASDIDNLSYDGCTDVHLEIRRDADLCDIEGNSTYNNDGHPDDSNTDPDDGAYVSFCCNDLIEIDEENDIMYGEVKVWLRVWDDGDMDGTFGSAGDNFNETWAMVRVEDKLTPTVACPSSIIIPCVEDVFDYSIVGKPVVLSTCIDLDCVEEGGEPVDRFKAKPANNGPWEGTFFPAYDENCGFGAIERTWKCGQNTCVQWVILEPQDPEDIVIIWPEDLTVNCLDGTEYEPVIQGQQCELLGVNLQSDTFNFEEEVCFRIINTWSIINWCEYDINDTDLNSIADPEDDNFTPGLYEHSQVINMKDFDPPQLMVRDSCYDVGMDCYATGVELKASGTDEGTCGSSLLNWTVEIDLWSDTTTDWVYSSTIFQPQSEFYISPTAGSGSFVNPTIPGQEVCVIALPEPIMNACNVQHTVLWTVSDGCGNFTTETSFFEVKDKKKPTPYCVNLNTALMENGRVDLWAIDFDAGSFDNCSADEYLRFTFSDVPPEEDSRYIEDRRSSSKIFDCGSLEEALNHGGILPVEVYVWDECGNYDFCIINLKLIDNTGNCGLTGTRLISGTVKTENGVGVSDVMIRMADDLWNNEIEQMTDDNGNYAFINNTVDVNYLIDGSKDVNWLNGVSTLDLVIMQQYILGISTFDSPYKMIAADVNNDDRVSSIDLIELRKLILDIHSEIEGNQSWRIVSSDQSLPLENPWPFLEQINIQGLSDNMLTEDFIGIKVGDVNNSVILQAQGEENIGNRNGQIQVEFENTELQKGEEDIIYINSNQFNNIYGFQCALAFEDIEFLGFVEGDVSLAEANANWSEGILAISWTSRTSTNNDGNPLFGIKVKALEDINTFDAIRLDHQTLQPEIYQGSTFDVLDLKLIESTQNSELALFQNEPNPWKGQTNISFTLSEAGNATLGFYDLHGNLLKEDKNYYEKGTHTIAVKDSDFPKSTTVIYYELKFQDVRLTKKMLWIE